MFHKYDKIIKMSMKKRATGIIVEYNPLHNGHLYHLKETKKIAPNDCIIAIMSGNFVQRGMPSIIDKWTKTKYALESGIDLVIELPTPFVLQSAETFARTAIHHLNLMKVHQIVYGSESLVKPTLSKLDHSKLKLGHSYAKSKNIHLLQSNEILGAYYEKFSEIYQIKTHRILRTNKYHDLNIDSPISSASAIRNAYNQNIPFQHATSIPLNKLSTYHLEDYYPLIRYSILAEKEKINQYLLVDEGIENLLIKLAYKHDNVNDFLESAVSKRYTRSRIQRTLMHILLKTPRDLELPDEIRVLGMNQMGKAYLNQIKKETKIVSFKNYQLKDYEDKATFIYGLPYQKENQLLKLEVGPPIII